MRLADGPLACVGCHVVDVHPDPFVGGRRYLEVLWIVTSVRAALLDTGHVPGFGDSSVVSSPGLDYRLGYQHLRRYVPPRGQPVVDRDSLHDVAAAVDRACVALYCGLAVAGGAEDLVGSADCGRCHYRLGSRIDKHHQTRSKEHSQRDQSEVPHHTPPSTGDLVPRAHSPTNYIALLSQGTHPLSILTLVHATWQMDRAINVSTLC